MLERYKYGNKKFNFDAWTAIYFSVCILSIILGLAIYKVNKKLNKNQIISFLITIGAMYLLRDYITARAQLVTFIMYILILYFIEKFIENPKKFYYGVAIIISSILIANLHVAVWPFLFILSLPYIAEYFICCLADFIIYRKFDIFRKKLMLKILKNNKQKTDEIKNSLEQIYVSNEKRKALREAEEPYKIRMKRNKNVKWLILVMVICGFTGLLTPIGTTPYTYLYKTMIGNTVHNINEHLPLTLINNIPIMCTIIIILALLIFTKTKIRLSDLFMIGGLTYLMFSSRRQSTMFIIIGSVIVNRMIIETIKIYEIEKMGKIINGYKIVLSIGIVAISLLLSMDYMEDKKDDVYVSKSSYPVDAANWILENLDVSKIKLFNEYNYGSYLLYRGIPVFIDSRADLYAPEFNKTDENSGKDIFMDFINTSNIGEYYGTTFKNYNITHVILYKNAKIRMLIDATEPENYDKIYQDDYFVIYEVL